MKRLILFAALAAVAATPALARDHHKVRHHRHIAGSANAYGYADIDANTLGYAYPNAIRDANSDTDANAGAEDHSIQRGELHRRRGRRAR